MRYPNLSSLKIRPQHCGGCPLIEVLESRIAPATASFSAGTFTLQGLSASSNNTTVTFLSGNQIQFVLGNGDSFTSTPVSGDFTLSQTTNPNDTLTVNVGPGHSHFTQLNIFGGSASNTLLVDLTGATSISLPTNPITLTNDGNITFQGATAQGTVTYTPTGVHSGSIAMSDLTTFNFTGTPQMTDQGPSTDVIFNLPTGGTNAASLGGNQLSGSTFPTTNFGSPSGSLTINAGTAADTLAVSSLGFVADLTLGASAAPFNSISFAADFRLSNTAGLTASTVAGGLHFSALPIAAGITDTFQFNASSITFTGETGGVSPGATIAFTGTSTVEPHSEIILLHNDGGAAVTGSGNTAEGTQVEIGGFDYHLTYNGGAGHDIALEPGTGLATTHTVTTLKDITNANHSTGSLRDAIALALADADGGDDTIVFKTAAGHPLTGTIKLVSDLPAIDFGITIVGPTKSAGGLVINGNGHEIFDIAMTDGAVSLSNLTVTHGLAANGGGIYINEDGQDVTIANVKVIDNKALGVNGVSDGTNGTPGTARGGGIYIHYSTSGAVTIVDSVISGNTATGGAADTGVGNTAALYVGGAAKGGGIYAAGYSLMLENTIVSGNIATGGKGGRYAGTTAQAVVGATGGNADGGGIYHGGTGALTLVQGTRQTRITGNSAVGGAGGGITGGGGAAAGGGINDSAVASSGLTLSITNGLISKNRAVGGNAGGQSNGGAATGGGVYTAGNLFMSATIVTHNAAVGGAAGKGGSGNDANLYGSNGTNGGYGGSAAGGGIALVGAQTFMIESSTISGNTAQGFAGGAGGIGGTGARGDKAAAIPGFYGGAGGNGGVGGNAIGAGIYLANPSVGNAAGYLTLTNSTVSNNIDHAGEGGAGGKGGDGGAGIGGAGSHVAQAGGNGGNGGYAGTGGNAGGGGIYAGGGSTLFVQASTISGNRAAFGKAGAVGAAGHAGAGVYRYMGTVTRGSAGSAGGAASAGAASGGGILTYGGSISLSLVTICKNTAAQGGGIDIEQDISAAIHNSTIAENTAHDGGGMFVTLDGSNDPVDVVSTIVAMNKLNPGGSGADIDGTIDADHDLIQAIAGATFTDPFTITGKSPLLGALGLHGGPTAVFVPSAKSPVIGTGVNPDSLGADQRGATITGAIDIGSVQVA